MRLAKLSEFRRLVYTPESAPCLNTLRARIDRNKLPGGRVEDGHYYVDLDEYDRANGLRASINAKLIELEKDLLLSGLI